MINPVPAGRADKFASFSGRVLLLLTAASLSIALVACGGSKKSDSKSSSSSGSSTPAASASASASGSGTPSSSTTPTSSGTPKASGTASTTTSGNSIAAGKLADLNSYSYNLKMAGQGGPLEQLGSTFGSGSSADVSLEASGSYVKPDKAQMAMTISGIKITRTVLGQQEWSSFNGTTTGPEPVTSTSPDDLSLAVAFWDDGFLDNAKDFNCSGNKETINGVATRRCSIDKDTFQKLANLSGGSIGGSNFKELTTFTFDAWLAEDKGYPARFQAAMKGKDNDNQDFNFTISLDVTDVNKPIEIKAPS